MILTCLAHELLRLCVLLLHLLAHRREFLHGVTLDCLSRVKCCALNRIKSRTYLALQVQQTLHDLLAQEAINLLELLVKGLLHEAQILLVFSSISITLGF